MSTRLSAFVLVPALCAATVACGNAAPPMEEAQQVVPEAPPVNPLVGTWSITTLTSADGTVTPAQPGLVIFGADGYFSFFLAPGAEPRAPSAMPFEPTDEEKVAHFDSLVAGTGRYEVAGSNVTYRPMLVGLPEMAGGHMTQAFVTDGNSLTLTGVEVVAADGTSVPPTGGMTLQRLP